MIFFNVNHFFVEQKKMLFENKGGATNLKIGHAREPPELCSSNLSHDLNRILYMVRVCVGCVCVCVRSRFNGSGRQHESWHSTEKQVAEAAQHGFSPH
jgi:hypothetical protein